MTFADVYVYDLHGNPYSIDTTSYDKFWMGYSGVCFMGPGAMQANGVFTVSVNC